MRRHLLLTAALLAATASCGSTLGDAGDPPVTTTLPEWTSADCMMFNPTACRLDVAKTSVGIDVHYPNTSFCRLQLLPTSGLIGADAFGRLAATWRVSMGYGPNDQTVIAPEIPQLALEYSLGTAQLYLTRVTFQSASADTLATLVANALGPDVAVYAVPLECPGRRPTP
jgi:hypothetical protein